MDIPRLIHKSVHYSNVSVPGKRLTVKKRDEDDQGDRIEVLKQIIWSAVERHGSGLRDEIVPDLDPAHEVKRQEQEELASCYTGLYILYRFVGEVWRFCKAMTFKGSTSLQSSWSCIFESTLLDRDGYNLDSIDDC